ncbi:MAG: hypothetical protein M3680_36870 [Myxococcota bacterium]|nr:hypothetical protein [Myxococcota bacterium]
MRRILVVVSVLAVSGCGSKKEGGAAAGSGAPTVVAPAPVTCPPGNVVQDGACVAVVTPETIAVVTQQQTRLDDLAKLLDQVEVVAAPVELLDGFRQLPQWAAMAEKSAKLRVAETVVVTLNDAVKKLRELKGSLGEASVRLGNLKGELDAVMTSTGAARQLEDVRTKVSSELRGALEPLAIQVQDTIQNALTPLATQLSDMGDLVLGACAMAKLSGGGDQMKTMCDTAKVAFANATAFVTDFKERPAALYNEISTTLETELAQLVDAAARTAIDTAQTQISAALNLPPATNAGVAGSAAVPMVSSDAGPAGGPAAAVGR